MLSLLLPAATDRPRHTAAWSLAWAALALGFTWLLLQWSFEKGRLALPPDYDDSVYMEDALARLDAIEADGLGALPRMYVEARPHAPGATALAMIGFAIFGRHDWAPYAMNAVLVFLLLLGVDHLMRGAWPVARLLAAAFVLSLPMTGMLVTEFRPDIACALLAAFGSALLLRGPVVGRSVRRLAGAGLCFGAALLFKPSVTPMTVGILGLASGLAVLRDRLSGLERAGPRALARTLGWVGGTALLAALPYAVVHAGAVATYIWEGIWGPARVLGEAALSVPDALRYYVDGDGGRHMVHRHAPLLVALPALALAWLLHARRWRSALTFASFGLLVLVVYAVITVNHVKTQFLGAPFYALVFFGNVLVLRGTIGAAQAGHLPRPGARVVVGAVALAAMALFTYPMPRALPDAYGPRRVALRDAYAAIEAHRRPASRLFFTAIGLANQDLVRYWQRRAGRPVIAYVETPLENSWARFEPLLRDVDIVVAFGSGNSEAFAHLTDEVLQERILTWLADQPAFERVTRIPTHRGDGLTVWVRRAGR